MGDRFNWDHWANALTDDRLASDLRRLADNIRFYPDREQRAAILREADRRLRRSNDG